MKNEKTHEIENNTYMKKREENFIKTRISCQIISWESLRQMKINETTIESKRFHLLQQNSFFEVSSVSKIKTQWNITVFELQKWSSHRASKKIEKSVWKN